MGKGIGEKMSDKLNESEFLQGQKDCMNGVEHKDGTESYNRGYAAQYQHEQNQEAMSGN